MNLHIGCAGWSIPKQHADQFPSTKSHLERYADRCNAVEINSSFYRPHRPVTYARWAASVPPGFRFAVKVPRAITHECCLADTEILLDRFLADATQLGTKLGPLLVQLPPSFAFEGAVAEKFFSTLRIRHPGPIVFEPRHKSWFTAASDRLLVPLQIARVAADPAVVPDAAEPGGWNGLVYYRLHGTPRVYYSTYSEVYLDKLSARMAARSAHVPVWCIFDNTALGAATANALGLAARLQALRNRGSS